LEPIFVLDISNIVKPEEPLKNLATALPVLSSSLLSAIIKLKYLFNNLEKKKKKIEKTFSSEDVH